MTMPPGPRTVALTAQITAAVGRLGTATAVLALADAALTGEGAQSLRAADLAMEPITWLALVLFALAAATTHAVDGPRDLTHRGQRTQRRQRYPCHRHTRLTNRFPPCSCGAGNWR